MHFITIELQEVYIFSICIYGLYELQYCMLTQNQMSQLTSVFLVLLLAFLA